jgi:two-component system, chemotaxis family, CheB/CheR fusion protein
MNYKHIVAIGGSAGSLDPLIEFFDNTPLDNTAYFVLQHIPKQYESKLHSILQRFSTLTIKQAVDDEVFEKNVVYLTTPKNYMTISLGKIKLVERPDGSGLNTIDLFLQSVVKEKQSKNCIAVILSGTGKDGTIGSKALSKSGGFIIAQDPDSCRFSSMPNSCIESGNVNSINEAKDMPDRIMSYLSKKSVSS